MKKILVLIIAITIISCNEEVKQTGSLQELKSQKTLLVGKIDSLTTLLKSVENEILLLDPNSRLPIITTIPVKNKTFKHYVEIQGVVAADKNIDIRPELGGTITNIFVKEGQRVSAGQTLMQLDDSAIKNSIAELNTQLSLAKTTFERQERLWNQKIGSEMQYLQAKAQLEGLQNSLATLNTQAKKMKVIAPFSGVVDEIFPKKGELTSPQVSVVRLMNLDKIYVEADVTESFLPVIKIGTEAVLNFSSINKEVVASVSQIGNFINPDNRSFKTRIDLNNTDHSIKPNLLADLKILDFQKDGIVIPSNLVQQDQNGRDYVFSVEIVNDENRVVKKLISIEKEYNHEVFIIDGLIADDVLIDEGARLVKTGDIVKINNKLTN
jgi:RND family efflux transporter MFP subunit